MELQNLFKEVFFTKIRREEVSLISLPEFLKTKAKVNSVVFETYSEVTKANEIILAIQNYGVPITKEEMTPLPPLQISEPADPLEFEQDESGSQAVAEDAHEEGIEEADETAEEESRLEKESEETKSNEERSEGELEEDAPEEEKLEEQEENACSRHDLLEPETSKDPVVSNGDQDDKEVRDQPEGDPSSENKDKIQTEPVQTQSPTAGGCNQPDAYVEALPVSEVQTEDQEVSSTGRKAEQAPEEDEGPAQDKSFAEEGQSSRSEDLEASQEEAGAEAFPKDSKEVERDEPEDARCEKPAPEEVRGTQIGPNEKDTETEALDAKEEQNDNLLLDDEEDSLGRKKVTLVFKDVKALFGDRGTVIISGKMTEEGKFFDRDVTYLEMWGNGRSRFLTYSLKPGNIVDLKNLKVPRSSTIHKKLAAAMELICKGISSYYCYVKSPGKVECLIEQQSLVTDSNVFKIESQSCQKVMTLQRFFARVSSSQGACAKFSLGISGQPPALVQEEAGWSELGGAVRCSTRKIFSIKVRPPAL